MKKILLACAILLAATSAQAADYFLPYIECDGTANVRSAPTTQSPVLLRLDHTSAQHKITGRQGQWYRLTLPRGKTGFVHQSQGYIVKNYIVAAPDGSANLRHGSFPNGVPIGQTEILKTFANGTRVQIVPKLSQGDWLFHNNQGTDAAKDESGHPSWIEGYIHKSQLRLSD